MGTEGGLGITAHGLRHEALIEEYIAITGQEPPLRGGGEGLRACEDLGKPRQPWAGWAVEVA